MQPPRSIRLANPGPSYQTRDESILPVQAIQRQRGCRRRSRLQGSRERTRRQRAAHHHRQPYADAKQEATRDGAPPVDLIDGERLCDLLREYEPGVRRTIRQIGDVDVVPEFLADL